MLRLHQIFFSHLVILLSLLFLFVSLFSYYEIRKIEINDYTKELETILNLLDEKIDVRKIDKTIHVRVTVIDDKGRVLAESRFDPRGMENHLNRPEIQEASKRGWGRSVRHSSTLHQDFLYVAKRMANGKFVRLAKPLAEIKAHFIALWIRFIALFALFILVALFVSYVLSRKIKDEVEKIIHYVEAIWQKEYEKNLKSTFSKEFEMLSMHLKKLAKRLQKREEKKRRYRRKIKQISQQRTELISAISHEFKNPVAIIHGYAQTLLEEDVPQSLQRKFLQKIFEASNKISYMIDRMGLAMKFESGSLQPQKSEFDLCEVAKEALDFVKQRYPQREVQLKCQREMVYADRHMIETVILNLVENALKYSELEVVIQIVDGCVEIRDRGIGIKPEELEKITKKFYRVRQSWDNSMGLGLYIVKYILQLHNSHLEIESEFGKGSLFRFCLPNE